MAVPALDGTGVCRMLGWTHTCAGADKKKVRKYQVLTWRVPITKVKLIHAAPRATQRAGSPTP